MGTTEYANAIVTLAYVLRVLVLWCIGVSLVSIVLELKFLIVSVDSKDDVSICALSSLHMLVLQPFYRRNSKIASNAVCQISVATALIKTYMYGRTNNPTFEQGCSSCRLLLRLGSVLTKMFAWPLRPDLLSVSTFLD